MRRLLVVAALVATQIAFIGVAWGQTGVGSPPPSASIGGLTVITPGEQLTVTGANWPQGNVNVVLCGNGGAGGSGNCDLPGARTVGAELNGDFRLLTSFGAPPVPCPCVIKVSSLAASTEVLLPVSVIGVEERTDLPAAPAEPVQTTLKLNALDVQVEGGIRNWLGAGPEVTLSVEIENVGTVQTGAGVVEVTYGKDEKPDQPAGAADVKPLMPGEKVQITMPFRLDTPTYGTYTIRGQVDMVNAAGTFSTEVTVFPWAWLIVALILIQVGFVMIRNRVRARSRADVAAQDDQGQTDPEGDLAGVAADSRPPPPVDGGQGS